MQQQSSNVALWLALALAAVAALASVPAGGPDTATKALWLLTTQAAAGDADGSGNGFDIDETQMMGMP